MQVLLAMRGTPWSTRTGRHDEPDEGQQQPAGEEAAPESPNTKPPNPPADERQEEQAPEEEQRVEVSTEEDAEMGMKDGQDRMGQADDTIEQNDQSPPKRGVGRPVKKVLPLPEERTPGCQVWRGESHSRSQRDILEEATAQKKQGIEEEQRKKGRNVRKF